MKLLCLGSVQIICNANNGGRRSRASITLTHKGEDVSEVLQLGKGVKQGPCLRCIFPGRFRGCPNMAERHTECYDLQNSLLHLATKE